MTNSDHDVMLGLEQTYLYNRVTFWLNGKEVVEDIPPARTVMDYLHRQKALFGTKCSCNEGDCGACTVVIAQIRDGKAVYEAVNSCLYSAARLHGKHLITVEGLGSPDHLHPVQQAMLRQHATQCGYCTPGFVMSMFALFATQTLPDDEAVLSALEGNLCRCTGYDSILKAAHEVAESASPVGIVPLWCREGELLMQGFTGKAELRSIHTREVHPCRQFHTPESLNELFGLMYSYPEHVLIAGGTDIMVQMNIQRKQYPVMIELGGISTLNGITDVGDSLRIGAGVTYRELSDSASVNAEFPCLIEMIRMIASQQIRNFGTLAGNIANASPIGDSLPLLLALDARLELIGAESKRELPLAKFFLEYRKTALKTGEIIGAVLIPKLPAHAFIRVSKAAKRRAVDISAVASAMRLECVDGIVRQAVLALGGVAATPIISKQFYKAMINMEIEGLHPREIGKFVADEFSPLSDVRGSKEYRARMIANTVRRHLEQFIREVQNG